MGLNALFTPGVDGCKPDLLRSELGEQERGGGVKHTKPLISIGWNIDPSRQLCGITLTMSAALENYEIPTPSQCANVFLFLVFVFSPLPSRFL